MFHSFLSNYIKQDDSTTAVHSKRIMGILQIRTLMFSNMSTIWGYMGGYEVKHQCATALYLLSMLEHA